MNFAIGVISEWTAQPFSDLS